MQWRFVHENARFCGRDVEKYRFYSILAKFGSFGVVQREE